MMSLRYFLNQVIEVKQLLSKYFLDKIDAEIDKLSQEKNWTEQTFVEWAKEHNRIY
jgi:hypothetical protein